MGNTSSDSSRPVRHSSGLPGFGLFIAIGMIVSTIIAARAYERVRCENRIISVKGYAEKRITSDLATWTGRFEARDAALVPAYNIMSTDLRAVLAWLEQNGVTRDDVGVSSIGTSLQYKKNAKGEDTNDIERYVFAQSVSVSSTDVALVTKIAAESTALIKEGIEFSSDSPDYFYTKLDSLKIEMLGQAAKDSRARAEQLIAGSGSVIGPLRSAEQGIFQITPPYSTETSGGGVNDTSSIDKVIKAVVNIDYTLK